MKVFWLMILTIITVLTFSLSLLPDLIHGIAQSKAPWRVRTQADVIYDLRLELIQLQLANSYFSQENRLLRRLVFTTKPDHWLTWLHLLDEVKRLQNHIEKLDRKIRGLEIKLRLWTPDLLQPIIPQT